MAMKAKKSKSKSKSKVTKVSDSSNDFIANYKIPDEDENEETTNVKPMETGKKINQDSIKSPPIKPISETSVKKIISKPKQRITKSIYFADSDSVIYLENIIARYPKNSLSSIIQQLVNALIKADNNERIIELNTKIYL